MILLLVTSTLFGIIQANVCDNYPPSENISLANLLSYLTTDRAGVGFDPSVKPHVPGQHVTAGETSLTNITKVSLESEIIMRWRM